MSNRLPLTVGFARVSQSTEDADNLQTQTQHLQDYGVHEVVTEVGSGARSDRTSVRQPALGGPEVWNSVWAGAA